MSAADGGPQPAAHNSDGVSRRGFLERGAAAGSALGLMAIGGSQIAPRFSPVGRARAIPPVAFIAGAAVAGTAINWAINEGWEALTSEDLPEGLTADALSQKVYDAAKARESTNASTHVDNRNILDGAEHNAYAEGKIAAIEELNAESSQDAVLNAAHAAVDEYATTVEKNLLKSWNEAVRELQSFYDLTSSHSDVNVTNVIEYRVGETASSGSYPDYHDYGPYPPSGSNVRTHTLPDGSTFDVEQAAYGSDVRYDPGDFTASWGNGGGDAWIQVKSSDSDNFSYLRYKVWNPVLNEVQTTFEDVKSGLQTWVSNVYGDVAAGEIDTSELLSPREQARMMSEDEDVPNAIADLMALNIPVDVERQMTIEITETGTRFTGVPAPTSEPEGGLNVGDVWDPSAESWDFFLHYNTGTNDADWTSYETAMPERVLTFTEEPPEDLTFSVETETGTAELTKSDFTAVDDDSNGIPETWTVDVSDQIDRTSNDWTEYQTTVDGGTVTFTSMPDNYTEFDVTTTDGQETTLQSNQFTANDTDGDGTTEEWTIDTDLGITEIESVTANIDKSAVVSVTVSTAEGAASNELIRINQEFKILNIEDSDGNEYDSADFENSEPQDDTNYITQEEWEQLKEQNEELIKKYEEAKADDSSGGDDGIGIGLPSFFDGGSGGLLGLGIIGVVVLSIVGIVTDAIPGLGN